MGNCHQDGKRIFDCLCLAFAPNLVISISISISIGGAWGRRKHLCRYSSCLRCDFRVSRTGQRHPPIGDVAGSTTHRHLKVTFGLDVFGPATLTAPCFALLVAASNIPNWLSLSKARPTAPQPTSAGLVTQETGGRCLPNGGISAKKNLESVHCAFKARLSTA